MATYKVIASTTVGSGGTNPIEFTSIPATYTDLLLKVSARTDNNNNGRDYVRFRFNSSSSTIYSYKWLHGFDGNIVSGGSDSALNAGHILIISANDATTNTFSNNDMYITDYAGSNNKSLLITGVAENNTSNFFSLSQSGATWGSTSAITSISLYAVGVSSAQKFVQYTTATLYGIKNS